MKLGLLEETADLGLDQGVHKISLGRPVGSRGKAVPGKQQHYVDRGCVHLLTAKTGVS